MSTRLDLRALTAEALRTECERHNLATDGSRRVLVERIEEAARQAVARLHQTTGVPVNASGWHRILSFLPTEELLLVVALVCTAMHQAMPMLVSQVIFGQCNVTDAKARAASRPPYTIPIPLTSSPTWCAPHTASARRGISGSLAATHQLAPPR